MYILLAPPLIVALILLALMLFLLKHHRLGVVSLLMAIIINIFTQSYPIHLNLWERELGPSELPVRVLEYNIHGNGAYITQNTDSMCQILAMFDSVQADLLFLPEYSTKSTPALNDSLRTRYTYNMRDASGTPSNFELNLYSRYPIELVQQYEDSDSTLWHYLNDRWAAANGGYNKRLGIYHVVVRMGQQPVSLIYCHLYSNKYSVARNQLRDSVRWIDGRSEYKRNLSIGYGARAIEARLIRDSLATINRPVLVCGDMNDLSGSYTLRTIMGRRLKDAWWESGTGFGFTYDEYHLLLRLDHILYSPEFEARHAVVLSHYNFSDHLPLVSDLVLHSTLPK